MDPIYVCPVALCPWEGPAGELRSHFTQAHANLLFQTNSAHVNLEIPRENLLLSLEEEIFLLQSVVEKTRLFLKLRFLGSPQAASQKVYDIFITSQGTTYGYGASRNSQPVIKPNQEGWEINLDLLESNTNFLICEVLIKDNGGTIPEPIHINNPEIEENICDDTEIKLLDALSAVDQRIRDIKLSNQNDASNEDIFDRISYFGFDKLEEHVQSQKERRISLEELPKDNFEFNENLSDIDEEINLCYKCHSDMLPPIYLCTANHSICAQCKSGTCNCDAEITDIRNTELEEISRSQRHPCQYARNGCIQKFRYNELLGHEIKCKFCIYTCEKCWMYEGKYENFLVHLQASHPSITLAHNLTHQFPKNSEFFIVKRDKGIFYCKSVMKDDKITWTVTFCGRKERRFFCELYFKGGKMKEPMFLKKKDMENVYEVCKTKLELKKLKVKEKYAYLAITGYDN